MTISIHFHSFHMYVIIIVVVVEGGGVGRTRNCTTLNHDTTLLLPLCFIIYEIINQGERRGCSTIAWWWWHDNGLFG